MRISIGIVLLLWSASAAAGTGETAVRVLTPVHQPAEVLLPALTPLVPAPGKVAAFRGQLVVEADETTLREVESAFRQLDRPAALLEVSVRYGPGREVADGAGRVISTRSRDEQHLRQRIRVTDGAPAFIRTGREVPVAERSLVPRFGGAAVVDTTGYRRADTGVWIRPRLLAGGTDSAAPRVVLDVSAHRRRPAYGHGGAFEQSELATRLVVKIGEWTEIGGVVRPHAPAEYRTRSRRPLHRPLFVKVEIVP